MLSLLFDLPQRRFIILEIIILSARIFRLGFSTRLTIFPKYYVRDID